MLQLCMCLIGQCKLFPVTNFHVACWLRMQNRLLRTGASGGKDETKQNFISIVLSFYVTWKINFIQMEIGLYLALLGRESSYAYGE